jgi:DNA-binding response OmpR family regulator
MDNFVLIVDDEEDICFLLGSVLSKRKYSIVYANTLQDAYSKLGNIKPSIVFLDLNLPDGYGLDAISTIRQLHPHTKIAIISAYDTQRDRHLAKQRGAHIFIEKPFNHQVIDSSLEKLQQ